MDQSGRLVLGEPGIQRTVPFFSISPKQLSEDQNSMGASESDDVSIPYSQSRLTMTLKIVGFQTQQTEVSSPEAKNDKP